MCSSKRNVSRSSNISKKNTKSSSCNKGRKEKMRVERPLFRIVKKKVVFTSE